MRILLDARLYGLENAGLGRYIVNLVRELAQLDLENEYIILLRRKYFDELSLPKNWQKILADFPHYGFYEQTKLPKLINSFSPDLVHFPHFNIPILYRGKFVVTIHDMLMHKQKGLDATTLSAPFYFIKRLAYRLVFDTAVNKSTAIIVPSNAVKNELLNYYNISSEKISVTYEGFDPKISTIDKIDVQKPYFVYAGNAYPHKNLKRLIEAVVSINRFSKTQITLAISSARNVFTNRLQNLIEKLKATKYVKLLGFVEDRQLGGLYKNSEAFVFPSVSEGFGLPGLEAMNAGTLVTASDIPVFKEIYKDNAIYFNPLDFSSIQNTLVRILELDQKERQEKIKRAIEFAKKYSWNKMAKETMQIYKNTAQK